MNINESIFEVATLDWVLICPALRNNGGEDVVQSRFARTLTPALSQQERGRREAIRRLSPAIPEEATACASHADRRATVRKLQIVQIGRRLNP